VGALRDIGTAGRAGNSHLAGALGLLGEKRKKAHPSKSAPKRQPGSLQHRGCCSAAGGRCSCRTPSLQAVPGSPLFSLQKDQVISNSKSLLLLLSLTSHPGFWLNSIAQLKGIFQPCCSVQ